MSTIWSLLSVSDDCYKVLFNNNKDYSLEHHCKCRLQLLLPMSTLQSQLTPWIIEKTMISVLVWITAVRNGGYCHLQWDLLTTRMWQKQKLLNDGDKVSFNTHGNFSLEKRGNRRMQFHWCRCQLSISTYSLNRWENVDFSSHLEKRFGNLRKCRLNSLTLMSTWHFSVWQMIAKWSICWNGPFCKSNR